MLQAIFVFVAPPSLEDLAKRLFGRGTEDPAHIRKRLSSAKAEINWCVCVCVCVCVCERERERERELGSGSGSGGVI